MKLSQYSLTTDWTTTVWSLAEAKDFSSSLCVQTSSEIHPASCTMGTGSPFPGVKRGLGVMLTTHPHLVPRLRMRRSYTSSPLSACMLYTGQLYFSFYNFLNNPLNPSSLAYRCGIKTARHAVLSFWTLRGNSVIFGRTVKFIYRNEGRTEDR
jgi:hypothetical protein